MWPALSLAAEVSGSENVCWDIVISGNLVNVRFLLEIFDVFHCFANLLIVDYDVLGHYWVDSK